MKKQEIYMVDRADIDRIHQRIDATQAQNAKQNEILTAIQVQLMEVATIVKATPPHPNRPCPDFCSHMQEHKASDTPAGIRKDFNNHMTYHAEQVELAEKKSMTWYGARVGAVFMLLMMVLQIYLLLTHQIRL